jgi:ornithine cyclodeaminase
MAVLVLSPAEVEMLLPMQECIEVMAEALGARQRGEVHQPLRMVVKPPGAAGVMAVMPSYRGGDEPAFGLKAVGVFHDNPARGLDAHQGTVTLFDGTTGQPTAIMSASAVTAIRTAAVTGLATRLLAREDVRRLAIIGSGVQARRHLQSMAAVRDFVRVDLYSPTAEHVRRLAQEARETLGDGVEVVVAPSAREAVEGADVVVTATSSREPVLRREWLAPGAHVNAIGASLPTHRELDVATVAAAALFVDSRESAANEAGEFQEALREGAIAGPEHIQAELGELVVGAHPGRGTSDQLTLFRSLGLAVEDLMAAQHVVAAARARGVGVQVEL